MFTNCMEGFGTPRASSAHLEGRVSPALPSSSAQHHGQGGASPALPWSHCKPGETAGLPLRGRNYHPWKGGKTGVPVWNPTCRHCQVPHTGSPSKQPLPQRRFPSPFLLLLQLHSSLNLSIYSCSTNFRFHFLTSVG